ncbi:MAG: DUF4886 domain-containing protein [Eubacteriales bacterium]
MRDDKKRILIIGNSFSRDSLYYLRKIAETKDTDVTMGLLYMGGCDLNYHFETREKDVNSFYLNDFDIHSPTVENNDSLNRILHEQKWDIVVIQNYFDRLYSQVRDHEWLPVGADLSEYICSLQPDCRIMLNQIWSFELGFRYGETRIDRELQTGTDRYIQEKYAELAAGIKQRTGKDVGIVPIGQAIASARMHDSDVFSAEYDEEGVYDAWKNNRTGTGYDYGYGIRSLRDRSAGRLKLNRDGFHLTTLGRYLAGAVWFEILTGIDARTLDYIPPAETLGCLVHNHFQDAFYLFGTYCEPDKKYITMLNEIAHDMVVKNFG